MLKEFFAFGPNSNTTPYSVVEEDLILFIQWVTRGSMTLLQKQYFKRISEIFRKLNSNWESFRYHKVKLFPLGAQYRCKCHMTTAVRIYKMLILIYRIGLESD